MFLVRRAREIMQKDVAILPADSDFDAFLRQHSGEGGFKHVVVTRGNHIAGVVRVNTSLRRGVEQAYSGVRLGDVAQRNFTIARAGDIMFDVVQRMTRHDAAMAVVVKDGCRGRPADVVGVVSKEHIADSVAESIKPFG
jgi:chloride channel protein, CIC family